jgi:hypothetical protein
MSMLGRIFRRAHTHYHGTPIVSKYRSFETRDIIYECRCGHRKSMVVYDNYYTGRGFPIPTEMLMSDKEFNERLTSSPIAIS